MNEFTNPDSIRQHIHLTPPSPTFNLSFNEEIDAEIKRVASLISSDRLRFEAALCKALADQTAKTAPKPAYHFVDPILPRVPLFPLGNGLCDGFVVMKDDPE